MRSSFALDEKSTGDQEICLSPSDLNGGEVSKLFEALESKWIASGGPLVQRFEAAIKDITGFQYAVGTASCTAALQLAFRVLNVREGDEVWCPTLTFIASVAPAVQLGAVPRLFDIDGATWTIDVSLIEEELAIAARKGNLPRVIVATDLYGNPAKLDELTRACGRYGIPVIADGAASLGSFARGRHSGKGATISCVSFNGNKIITTGGGGALLTDDAVLADRARKLAMHAREAGVCYQHQTIGYSCLLSNLGAAFGLAQLSDLVRRIDARRSIFHRYVEAISSLPGIRWQQEAALARSNRWLTVVSLDEIWKNIDIIGLCRTLRRRGIEVRPIWRPLHRQAIFSGAPRSRVSNAERISSRGLCLPSGSQLRPKDQAVVIDALRDSLCSGL